MTHDFEPDNERDDAIPDREVARLVIELDELIARHRHAMALRHMAQAGPMPVPIEPTRAELMVIAALAQTYGAALLRNEFALMRNDIAEFGAVAVAQHALFEDASDPRSKEAQRLREARPLLEELCRRWPDVFLSEAQVALARLARRPSPSSEDEGEEGTGT